MAGSSNRHRYKVSMYCGHALERFRRKNSRRLAPKGKHRDRAEGPKESPQLGARRAGPHGLYDFRVPIDVQPPVVAFAKGAFGSAKPFPFRLQIETR